MGLRVVEGRRTTTAVRHNRFVFAHGAVIGVVLVQVVFTIESVY